MRRLCVASEMPQEAGSSSRQACGKTGFLTRCLTEVTEATDDVSEAVLS